MGGFEFPVQIRLYFYKATYYLEPLSLYPFDVALHTIASEHHHENTKLLGRRS